MRGDIAARSVTAKPPSAIGAPIMALGIFIAAALQRLPGGTALTKPLAAALAVAWAAAALALAVSLNRQGLAARTRPLVGSFEIGTWVAATAVLARLLMLAVPSLSWPAQSFFLMSVGLWLWFIPVALGNLARLAAASAAEPSGIILLATVATQAIALMGLRLFPDVAALRWAAAALMALGVACYAAGLVLILRRYARLHASRITADWHNGNCILHGALSITGLAAVVSGMVPVADILALWVGVVIAFAVVETVEVARLAARVKELGWRRGVWVYDLSQWARNFTFGMFYAFTLAFAERLPTLAAHPLLDTLRQTILAYGQYVVFLLLLAEILLLLSSTVPRGPDKGTDQRRPGFLRI